MEFARGKLVYVVGDADRAGQAGASRFARAFARVAREVRLVPLPYETAESHGKDLRDWVAEGGGPEGLRDLLEAATPVAAAEPPEDDPSEGSQGGLASPTPITPKEAVNDPHRLARRLLTERFGGLRQPELRFWREDFWRWKGDCYRAVNAADLRAEIAGAVKEILDREYLRAYAADLAEAAAGEGSRPKVPNVCRVTGPLVSDVRLALSSLCGIAADLEQPAWLDGEAPFPAAEVLVARNGLLHLPSLVAGQPSLLPPTPAFFSANALDYAFDPTAECPGWLQFLGALWPEDPQAIGLLQEWLGYLLLPTRASRRCWPCSGRSAPARGRSARHPPARRRAPTSAPRPCRAFRPASACPRCSARAWRSSATPASRAGPMRPSSSSALLSLTGEDALTVERKYREAVTTKLYARLILISNELPSLRDASGALASRMLVLQLVRSWYGTEDPDLTDRLLTELPGILNWSIGGWQRLRERGRFAQPDSGRELLESLEELASPVGTFVKECCWVGPGYHVGVKVLYDRWRSWCEETGRDYTGDLQHFGKNLRAVVPGLRLSRPRADQERVRFYEGIDLKLTGADF